MRPTPDSIASRRSRGRRRLGRRSAGGVDDAVDLHGVGREDDNLVDLTVVVEVPGEYLVAVVTGGLLLQPCQSPSPKRSKGQMGAHDADTGERDGRRLGDGVVVRLPDDALRVVRVRDDLLTTLLGGKVGIGGDFAVQVATILLISGLTRSGLRGGRRTGGPRREAQRGRRQQASWCRKSSKRERLWRPRAVWRGCIVPRAWWWSRWGRRGRGRRG